MIYDVNDPFFRSFLSDKFINSSQRTAAAGGSGGNKKAVGGGHKPKAAPTGP